MIPEPEQETIAKYMDVKSLGRTDSAMTGMAGRKEGVAEGVQWPGVCGAQPVASLQQREQQGQVQGPAVEPAASHQAAGLPAGEGDVSRNAYATGNTSEPCASLVTATSPSSWRRPGPSPGEWKVRTRWVIPP